MSGLSPLAIAVQGVGFSPLLLALQGFYPFDEAGRGGLYVIYKRRFRRG